MSSGQSEILDNRYAVIHPLGEGGFASAHLVQDTRLKRYCVAKVSKKHDSAHRDQFEQEARLLAALNHPNLPQVYDYFYDHDTPYLVMQFVEGSTLDQLADARLAPFDVNDVLRWARDLLDALIYLHSQQPPIIHRDIKPSNVRITPKGKAVLLDFGIARQLDGAGTRGVARSYTWHYSPLEQQLDDPDPNRARTGPFSDVYSLAATLYYALTLLDPPNACLRMTSDELLPVQGANPAVSHSLAAALEQALAVEPDKRCQTASALHTLLFGADINRSRSTETNPKGATKEMYTAEISRANPTCFLFLIDQSGSMGGPLGGQEEGEIKARMVADAINRLIDTLIARCTKDDGVRRYFQVGVIGYGATVGPAFGSSLAGRPLAWIDEVEANARIEKRQRKISDGAGGLIEVPVNFPVWFEPVANNGTPMCHALWQAHTLLEAWVAEHPGAYPPAVINITDGEVNDGDPYPASEAIRELATNDGCVLLLNLHLSSSPARSFHFPDSDEMLPDDYARMLFRMSSSLTPLMRGAAREMGYKITEDARGFVLNAGIEDVIQFLVIGTRPGNR